MSIVVDSSLAPPCFLVKRHGRGCLYYSQREKKDEKPAGDKKDAKPGEKKDDKAGEKKGADGKAKGTNGKIPFDYAKDNADLKNTKAYWLLNEAQY